MELNYIKDVLVAMTTIVTALGVLIKTLNKFFLDTIKSRYKMIPGKQSLFDTVLKSIMIFMSLISVLSSVIMVTYSLLNKGNNLNANELLNLSTNIYQIIGILIAILFYYLIFGTQYVFCRLQNMVIVKFEKKSMESNNKRKINTKSKYFSFKYIKNALNRIKNIKVKYFNIINLVISCCLGGSSLIGILLYIFKGIKKEDMQSILILGLIGIVSIISFIISISLLDVIELVHNNYIYEIVMEQGIIRCGCYLEYDDHYLVIENKKERYINKGKVKEIIKSKSLII